MLRLIFTGLLTALVAAVELVAGSALTARSEVAKRADDCPYAPKVFIIDMVLHLNLMNFALSNWFVSIVPA